MDRGIRVLIGIGVAVLIVLLLARAGSHGTEGSWIKTDPLPVSGGDNWVNLERVESVLFYRPQDGTETAVLGGQAGGLITDAVQLKRIHAYLEQRRFR